MALPVDVDAIIAKIAREEGIEESEVRKIVYSQFELVANTMEEGEFKAVRIPYFGVFKAKPERIAYVKNASANSKRGITRVNKRRIESNQHEAYREGSD